MLFAIIIWKTISWNRAALRYITVGVHKLKIVLFLIFESILTVDTSQVCHFGAQL
jgi:hypothetical protein